MTGRSLSSLPQYNPSQPTLRDIKLTIFLQSDDMNEIAQNHNGPAAPAPFTNPWLEFPLTYRVEQVAALARWASMGESVLLLGGSGTGKSNLLRFLGNRPDAMAPHIPRPVEQYCLFYFDMNSLPQVTDLYFYRGLIRTIYDTVNRQDLGYSVETREAVGRLVRRVNGRHDIFDVFTVLQRLQRLLILHRGKRIVWLLDRFGEAFQTLQPQTLNSLRGLRDEFKGCVSFVTSSRHPIGALRNPREIDELLELVAAHTCRLGPMTQADTMWNIERQGRRFQYPFPPALAERIAAVSGGLPAFVKQVCIALTEGVITEEQTDAHWAHASLTRRDFQRSCCEIWADLNPAEQETLKAVSADVTADQLLYSQAATNLLQMGWLTPLDETARHKIFSPIFEAFVIEKRGGLTTGVLSLDPKTHKLLRDGILLNTDLTDQEERLFAHLLAHPGKLCKKDELIRIVWPHENKDGNSVQDDRLTQLIRRLRQKVEFDAARPHYICTIRGKGYRFTQPVSVNKPAVSGNLG